MSSAAAADNGQRSVQSAPHVHGSGSGSGSGSAPQEKEKASASDAIPSNPLTKVSLPTGGGAIRSIGEKFSVNAVSGTGSIQVPVNVSAARSGFTPQLELSYSSGAGSGDFGYGWHLSLPSVTRKTDKGLPLYRDEEDSDTYILAASEDLVPHLELVDGAWVRPAPQVYTLGRVRYAVERYRPRVEAAYTRIEHWTAISTGDTHWRTITTDNVTSIFGQTNNSRVYDPQDPNIKHPTRVFSWLISSSYDDKGNASLYEYKEENSEGVSLDSAHELNRSPLARSAGRHLKRIKYGNRESRLVVPNLHHMTWMFEIVFDYGDHALVPSPREDRPWKARHDPYSTHRSCFEVRNYRLCERILMFHHFPDEAGIGNNCLVSSMDITYTDQLEDPNFRIASFVSSIVQRGYVRHGESYQSKAMPAIDLKYSQPEISTKVHDLDPRTLENLPAGLDDSNYHWMDLDGEGVSGILTYQGDAYRYMQNLGNAKFGPAELLLYAPSLATGDSNDQWIDLAGDGHLDLVRFGGPTPGFYKRRWDLPEGWQQFQLFASLPTNTVGNSNHPMQIVDLTGDGLPDILIANDEVFTWYPSLGELGYGAAEYTRTPISEQDGPRLLVSSETEAIYMADMSGDGLNDLLCIRNGEVCYWPNVGYGRFGSKVAMDNSPWFDFANAFRQGGIRLADVDGSGTTDIIYVGVEGTAQLYRNQAGNSWTNAREITSFPKVDSLAHVQVLDLLGRGTSCLVWSSQLPGDSGRQIRYIDLMDQGKPHLLLTYDNNMGLRTNVTYVASTKFYLQDKAAGTPWVTRLSFPVQVVERVETIDQVSQNRFVSRYRYRHGFFDGVEREFRGFGAVEQTDTEELAALNSDPAALNISPESNIPPVLTKTWYHTGAFFEEAAISCQFESEYYREPSLTDEEYEAMLLPDTILPTKIRLDSHTELPHAMSVDEMREACRALKGMTLRQEIYALDGSPSESRPYTASENSYTIEMFQTQQPNRYAVYATHAREAINFSYERQVYTVGKKTIADPRVAHSMTLATDYYGNVLLSASIAYGRRLNDPAPFLTAEDRRAQRESQLTYITNRYTNAISTENAHRIPMAAESSTYQLLNVSDWLEAPQTFTPLFRFDAIRRAIRMASDGRHDLPFEDFRGEGAKDKKHAYRRPMKQHRIYFRRDDMSGMLPLGKLEPLALPFESYQKAFTESQIREVFAAPGKIPEADLDNLVRNSLGLARTNGDGDWWVPFGRSFYSPTPNDSPAAELNYASHHFFLPLRYRDPFYTEEANTECFVTYDKYDLLTQEMLDAYGNRLTVGERNINPTLPLIRGGYDYRLLRPFLAMDSNRNRQMIAFDIRGSVVGSASMGKPEEDIGDNLDGFDADLSDNTIEDFFMSPYTDARTLLGNATSRFIYDYSAFSRTGRPIVMATLARVMHVSDADGKESRMMSNFSYFDGLNRTIQLKTLAGPQDGLGPEDQFVCSGWVVYDNKNNAIRKYEPFFTESHQFEFNTRVGVSPIVFYDPPGRVVATLFADNSWSKVVNDAWSSESWDANDTVLQDPRKDRDVGDYFRRLGDAEGLVTWYGKRINGQLGPEEQSAARKTQMHADTPARSYLDALGRSFLIVKQNKVNNRDEYYRTFTLLDMEGNKRQIVDPKNRIAGDFNFNMAAAKIQQSSMEAGQMWFLNDAAGKTVLGWDSRGQRFRTEYDLLRRPSKVYLLSVAAGHEQLVEHTVYGDTTNDPEANNIREKAYMVFDQAGTTLTPSYDFKGNTLFSQRQMAVKFDGVLDWSAKVDLEPEEYISRTTYDAVNRPITMATPENSVTYYHYNDVGRVDSIKTQLSGAQLADFVETISYDARGQRQRIKYGNGATTRYSYDPETFRITGIVTHRKEVIKQRRRSLSDSSSDSWVELTPTSTSSTRKAPSPTRKTLIQSLHHFYDPIGNVTYIRNDAAQDIFFRNKVVSPNNDYLYDALYRLLEATGREHVTSVEKNKFDTPNNHSRDHRSNGNALARYLERYKYDSVGSILSVRHESADETQSGWTRHYRYNEQSLLEADKFSNRLSEITVGSKSQIFHYEGSQGATGCVTLASSVNLQWDYKNQLMSSVRQKNSETTYYQYDSRGQRLRKVTANPDRKLKERIYFAGFERYRTFSKEPLERDTLRIMDEDNCVAMVETLTKGEQDGIPKQLIRYQFSSHLGSITIELDDRAQVLSYEEYGPYGGTTYEGPQRYVELPKRYRYSGKERDEESGLYYYGARYYLPLACRWMSCDPGGYVDGLNLYEFVQGNPITRKDPDGTESSWLNRGIGALKVLGGVMEITAGAAGVAAPTGVTQVLGVIAIVHGVDTALSGLKQVWTGESEKTFTEQAATGAAKLAGASDATAEKIGAGVDLAVGIIPSIGVGLGRAGAAKGAEELAASKGGSVLSKIKATVGTVADAAKEKVGALKEGAKKLLDSTAEAIATGGREFAAEGIGNSANRLYSKAANAAGGAVNAVKSRFGVIGQAGKDALRAKGLKLTQMSQKEIVEELVKVADEMKGGKIAGDADHHLLPQWKDLADFYKSKGITNIHDYTVRIPTRLHQVIHGNWGLMKDYRLAFFEWSKSAEGLAAKSKEVFEKMYELKKFYGLEDEAIIPYRSGR